MNNSTASQDSAEYKRYKLDSKFKNYLINENGLSYNTVKNYLSDLRFFLGWLQSNHPSEDVNNGFVRPQIIMSYASYLHKTVTSPITVKRRLSSLNKFIEFISGKKFRPELFYNSDSMQQTSSGSKPTSNRAQIGNDSAMMTSKEYYLQSILREYSVEKNSSQSDLGIIRKFLLFVHS